MLNYSGCTLFTRRFAKAAKLVTKSKEKTSSVKKKDEKDEKSEADSCAVRQSQSFAIHLRNLKPNMQMTQREGNPFAISRAELTERPTSTSCSVGPPLASKHERNVKEQHDNIRERGKRANTEGFLNYGCKPPETGSRPVRILLQRTEIPVLAAQPIGIEDHPKQDVGFEFRSTTKAVSPMNHPRRFSRPSMFRSMSFTARGPGPIKLSRLIGFGYPPDGG